MAKTAAQLEVEGLKELQKKAIQMLDDMRPASPVWKRAMLETVLKMQARAMKNPRGGRRQRNEEGKWVRKATPMWYVPVDTGRLRASITPSVEPYGSTIRGIVGTNVEYAPYQEFGTMRGVPAKGFFRAALRETEAWAKKRFGDAIQFILDKRP